MNATIVKQTETELEFDEQTPFEQRLYRIAEKSIPTNIDRTDDGEFIIRSYYPELSRTESGVPLVNGKLLKVEHTEDGQPIFNREAKKELAYFMNEDCILYFRTVKGKIKAYFYGDADNEYHFNINVKEKMSDDEIRTELIKGFSAKFGWIELFQDDITQLKGVDTKFWVVFHYGNKRKLIEVDRQLFDQYIKMDEEQEKDDNVERDEDEYDKLSQMLCEIASKHFKGLKPDEGYAELLNLTESDVKDCAFLCVNIAI